MKLAAKVNLFSLFIPAIMALIILISGLSVMTRVVYDLNYKIILKELNIIVSSIESDHAILKKAGVENYPHYVKQAKSEFIRSSNNGRFDFEGELLILDTISERITNKGTAITDRYPPITRDLFPKTSGEIRIENDQGRFYFNYVKIPYWNWIIVHAISSDYLFEDIYNYLQLVIPVSLIPLIIGFILSFFSLKNVYTRVDDSLICLKEVEKGKLNVRIDILPVKDEIQQIQKAINQMIDSLEGSYNELEQRVDERTGQLEMSNRKLIEEIHAGEIARSEISYLNQYLKNIIDSIPSILIGINRDLTINQWNPEAERTSFIMENEIINRPFSEVIFGENKLISSILLKISNNEVFSINYIKICLGKSRSFYADINYFTLKEKRNEMGILLIRDITEKYKLEELMKQSEKMLSVGSLAAGMAHEINNPLAGMMQNAQNIGRRLSKKIPVNIHTAEECGTTIEKINNYSEKRSIPEMVQSILKSGQNAADIVEKMINFNKNENLYKTMSSIPEIMEKALTSLENDRDFKESIERNAISILKNYEKNLPEISCAEDKIEEVFSNIIKNSIQALLESNSFDSTIRISIRKNKDEIIIRIIDNGPGMDDEIKKRVFEPFFSTKSVDQGKGLGLSTSYFIIREHHKGNLWLESKLGEGTSFNISLPLTTSREL